MAGSSCRVWTDAKGVGQHAETARCPESINDDQPEFVQLMECENVVRKYVDPDKPVKRRADLTDSFINHGGEAFQISSTKITGPCCMECGPRGAAVQAKQLTSLRRDKPSHKQAVRLDSQTYVGRVFPMKFRLRRAACKCLNCNRELALHETVTGNEDMLLLSDCCTVKIESHKQIENWNRVAVGIITGQQKISKKTLTESCKEDKKSVTLPRLPTKDPVRKSKKRRATKFVKSDKSGPQSKKSKN
ncbi:PREDICTED: uncharacterized protein LOC108616382 [Drosophila arizonae]|uniref:Uncharacterized protein LOC108616382 n=1 Tax=Drosophila arizonae TaxID=7263 RepID=A0ABM1PII5_DROAR|nr:PREDICTED: uncharacterized protein LOC108616382 [Drosophila arizonae]